MTILDIGEEHSLKHAGVRQTVNGVGRAKDFARRADAVAMVAAADAAAADRDARFPEAAIREARAQRLMGIMVPHELGGEGASVSEVADVCFRLGRACASAAMIYAMHQTKVACLVRHCGGSGWHQELLRRLCDDQLLLASSTTEGQGGGNIRSSAAPVERSGSRISLERNATVISYGAQADGIVTTARRSADAPASDQVLVAFLKEDYSLVPTMSWDTLGMRGTCSAGFALKASGGVDQILPDGYDKIHVQTMTPVAHVAWASVWAGIAATAVERAQAFIRKAARQANGDLPPGAAHFTKAQSSLRMLREVVTSALRRYELACEDERTLASLEFQTAVNLTKVDASELAVATVMSALRACGLAGFRNDGEFTLGRHLRDVLSSPIMINNDRILANIAAASLMSAVPTSLFAETNAGRIGFPTAASVNGAERQ
jgi:acyl-CoA dehydrogenase